MRGNPGHPRPNAWITGPDPVRHKNYISFLRQKAQANFRNEGWQFTFEEWLDLWGDFISLRGRGRGCMTMVRVDYALPWSKDNARIVDRLEHARVQQAITNSKRKNRG